MFNFFKKKKDTLEAKPEKFEIELTATILAYEIARSDGDISKSELDLLLNEVKKITLKVNKSQDEILEIIETYSKNSVSFHEFIEDINKDYSKEEKLSVIIIRQDVFRVNSEIFKSTSAAQCTVEEHGRAPSV